MRFRDRNLGENCTTNRNASGNLVKLSNSTTWIAIVHRRRIECRAKESLLQLIFITIYLNKGLDIRFVRFANTPENYETSEINESSSRGGAIGYISLHVPLVTPNSSYTNAHHRRINITGETDFRAKVIGDSELYRCCIEDNHIVKNWSNTVPQTLNIIINRSQVILFTGI